MHTKWFRDVPITYTGEDGILTDRGLMLLEDGHRHHRGFGDRRAPRWNLALLDKDYIRVTGGSLQREPDWGADGVTSVIYGYPDRVFPAECIR